MRVLLLLLLLTLPAAADPSFPTVSINTGEGMINVARRYIGTNPTGRRYLWCQDFVNLVLKKIGRKGTGSRHSHSSLGIGHKVSRAAALPGDIVVLKRGRTGGHAGIFVRWAEGGRKIVLVSGNSGGRRGSRIVTERSYPSSRIMGIRRVQGPR